MARKLDIKNLNNYEFTRSWFRLRNLPTFREFILPVFGDKPTTYLELGVFEGMSALWMLQYVLTHEDSRMVGVDPWLMTEKLDTNFMEGAMKRALSNTQEYYAKRELVRANSVEFLHGCLRKKEGIAGIKRDSVDICMIDGQHYAPFVLYDANLCLELTKVGGTLLFDDVENDKEKENHVKHAVEEWKSTHRDRIEFLWKDNYMEAYRRTK